MFSELSLGEGLPNFLMISPELGEGVTNQKHFTALTLIPICSLPNKI